MNVEDLHAIPGWFYDEIGATAFNTVKWFSAAKQSPGRRYRGATRDYWMLLIVGQGHLHVRHSGKTMELTDHTAAILPPLPRYLEKTITPSLVARLPIIAQGGVSLDINPLTSLSLPAVMPLANPASASRRLHELTQVYSAQVSFHAKRLIANGITHELVLNAIAGGFTSHIFPQTREGTVDWVLQCRKIFIDNYRDPALSVKKLATIVQHPPEVVQRKFAAAFGYPPKEWLHRYRIKQAAQLLGNHPELTVASLMDRCGYTTRSLFYTMFERYQGCKPGDLRPQNNAP